MWAFLIKQLFHSHLLAWISDDYSQLGATCLIGYLPSRIQCTLVELLLKTKKFQSLAQAAHTILGFGLAYTECPRIGGLGLNDLHFTVSRSKRWRSDESICLCGPESNPCIDAICELSLLLVVSFVLRGFSPGTQVFPSPQRSTLPIPVRPGIG